MPSPKGPEARYLKDVLGYPSDGLSYRVNLAACLEEEICVVYFVDDILVYSFRVTEVDVLADFRYQFAEHLILKLHSLLVMESCCDLLFLLPKPFPECVRCSLVRHLAGSAIEKYGNNILPVH